MLNPSTADAIHDDPTLASCRRISEHWNFGSLMVVNLFAYRATDPQQLRSTCDPVGIENNDYLEEASKQATEIVVAYGEQGAYRGRDSEVLNLLAPPAQPHPLFCLGKLQSGRPRHPLYMPASTTLKPYS
jgi:hypothetical protein